MIETDLAALIEALPRARVMCVGDVMIDHYIRGEVERISPEAPVPVLHIADEEQRLGGAGNVLRNLHALDIESCFISVTGADLAGRDTSRMVAELGTAEAHVLAERGRTTTVKLRYIADNQQLLRADREQIAPLTTELRSDLVQLVRDGLPHYGVVVLSDYAKGVLTGGVATEIIAVARAAGVTVVVDPKGNDYSIYRGASILKPNRPELAIAVGRALHGNDAVIAAARELIAAHEFGAMLVTCGKDGMLLVERDAVHALPAEAREVYDRQGAGDTVVAVLAAALGAGGSRLAAARLANTAAGIVVGKIGTAVATRAEIGQTLVERDVLEEHRKILPLATALDHVARWRRNGLSVGFTNGVFDLLHPGHISLLTQARGTCDRLVVGLNSDASVVRLKGPGRPVQAEAARAAVLASLAAVDLVVIFEDDTPLTLIEQIRPEVLMKGADYRRDQVVGGSFVESYGGKVMLAELVPGHSTTATIARVAG